MQPFGFGRAVRAPVMIAFGEFSVMIGSAKL